jgi:hypothetical protein
MALTYGARGLCRLLLPSRRADGLRCVPPQQWCEESSV